MCERTQLSSAAVIVTALMGTLPIQARAAEESSKQPVLHTVKQGRLKITAELEGVVVAETMHEIRVEPRSWDNFIVSEAVSYGSQVRKGDVLIRFDAQQLEDAIADLVAEEKLADLAIEQSEQELPQYEKSLNLELEAEQRKTRIAKQDSERFAQVERPVEEESSEWIMKSAQFTYESNLEELRQLQKMYEADDLTEETEEFILKRQRHSVEQARFRLKTAELERDRMKQLSIPRREETYRHDREMAELALAKAKNELALGLAEKRYTLEKMKHTRSRAIEKLARFNEDKKLMVLRAPAGGTVYYGRCVNGKWSETEQTATKLLPGGKVKPHEVLITVVNTQDVYVRAEVPQKHLPDLRVGAHAPVSVPAIGAEQIRGRLADVSPIPLASGSFAARVTLHANQSQRSPVPGMTCQVHPVVYAKQDALLVPTSAVGEDKWTGGHYVMFVERDRPPRKRKVSVGRRADDSMEILEGLSAGDKILRNLKEEPSS